MLVGLILAAKQAIVRLPNRVELGSRVSEVTFTPVTLKGSAFSPLRLAGAWQARSADPRFGGFSALALDRGRLLALTDNGVIAWLDKPGMRASHVTMRELPGGPGTADWRGNRDSEALVPDPHGQGWWVSFETLNQVWLYDPSFQRAIARVDFGRSRWPVNNGVEGMAAIRNGLLLFVEGGRKIYRMQGAKAVGIPVVGKKWRFSEALRLSDGRLIAIERTLSPFGFGNALAVIAEGRGSFRVERRFPLPVGMFDNLEGMTAEPLRDGSTRLWMITDDNFERPQRTLLLAVDLPPERQSD